MKQKSLPEWDLSQLYSGFQDDLLPKDKASVQKLTTNFVSKFKNKIQSPKLSNRLLLQAIHDYENILEKAYKYLTFASMKKYKDTSNEKNAKFFQSAQEFINEIHSQLLFFELEWMKHNTKTANALISSPMISRYQQYLKHERQFKPYRLSEKEEIIMSKKSQTSSSAWIRLYNEVNSNMQYPLKVGKTTKKLSYDQIMSYISVHPDRVTRKKASVSLSNQLKKKNDIYKYLLNTLVLDKKVNDEIRNFTYPEQATYLTYQIKQDTVDSMTSEIQQNYSIVSDFYNAKRKYLGHDQLHEWDRYSNIHNLSSTKITWNDAIYIILEVFGKFSPKFKQIAELFLQNNWIDAKITPGKANGAFCSYSVPSKHPLILVNFTGKLRDVLVLAHEFGHGIHAYLSRQQSILQYSPSTAIAEIASVFCETLVFEHLLDHEKDTKNKLNLLANRIQDVFATIFRQNAFFLFEKDIHKLRRKRGELSLDEINNTFQKRLQEMFAEGLQLTSAHKLWWMPVMHFFNYNFYVFTYSFGETLATSLSSIYKNSGKEFEKTYIKALTLGGSKNPYQILKSLHIDIGDSTFWQNGMKSIRGYVDEFIETSKNTHYRSRQPQHTYAPENNL